MTTAHDAVGRKSWRSALAGVAALTLAGVGLVASTPAAAAEATIKDATFTWSVNDESTGGSYFGGCNFLVAGKAGDAGSSKVWTKADFDKLTTRDANGNLVDGNVSIHKSDGTGTNYDNKCKTAAGASVNGKVNSQAADNHTGDYLTITGGTGTVNPETDTGTIQWKGSWTFVYYGGMTYWTITDPKLEVENGHGKITGTYSGVGADMDDPSKWIPELPTKTDTIVDLKNNKVDLTATGFTVTPDYLGVKTGLEGRNPQTDKTSENESWWGSFPDPWIEFNQLTNQDSYWFTSAGGAMSIQPRKVTNPIKVSYSAPAPKPEATTSIAKASKADGLVVDVAGKNFTDLPPAATNVPATGVYLGIIDRTKTADASAADFVGQTWVRPDVIKDGAFSASVTAAASKLDTTKDYDVVIWSAHGNPTAANTIARKELTLTDAQKEALFPVPTTEPTTQAPTTQVPTTPSTQEPSTEPSTQEPTEEPSTHTTEPSTQAPTTEPSAEPTTDAPDPETSLTVAKASRADGLGVDIKGKNYTDLPNSSIGMPATGVYVGIVDRTKSYPVAQADVLGAQYIRSSQIVDGGFTASVTALAKDLSKDADYDVIVWSAHGFPTEASTIYRSQITLSDDQKKDLFAEAPSTREPSESPSTEPAENPAAIKATVTPSVAAVGDKVTVSGLSKLNGQKVDVTFYSTPVSAGSETVKDGKITTTVPNLPNGQHSIVLSQDGVTAASASFTVKTAAAKPSVTASPKKIAASDFINKKKGVQIKVSGVTPGKTTAITVDGGKSVRGITLRETADKDGVARFAVYGTSLNASSYLGKYTVKVSDPKLSTTFTVVTDEQAKAGGDNDSSDQSWNDSDNGQSDNSLPRTGASLLAGGLGLLLLVVGATTVLVSRRYKN